MMVVKGVIEWQGNSLVNLDYIIIGWMSNPVVAVSANTLECGKTVSE